ncbi:MAG: DinB family protein [Spirochaetia bacterium]
MNNEDFRLLYDFNSWANRRTTDACASLTSEQFTRDLASSFRSVRDTLAHIGGSEWLWLERWHGRIPNALPSAEDFPTIGAIRKRLEEIDRSLVDYVDSLTAEDLRRVVQYKTAAGVAQAQPLWQMLQHLANHGTYHRGQVATMLRQLGSKATSTDLIGFYRERFVQSGA